jgi:hypothetical protein
LTARRRQLLKHTINSLVGLDKATLNSLAAPIDFFVEPADLSCCRGKLFHKSVQALGGFDRPSLCCFCPTINLVI